MSSVPVHCCVCACMLAHMPGLVAVSCAHLLLIWRCRFCCTVKRRAACACRLVLPSEGMQGGLLCLPSALLPSNAHCLQLPLFCACCSGELDPPFPVPISLATALAYFADMLSSPRKDALLGLASCATSESEAARLKLLASPQGKAEYTSYIAKQHRSLLEVRDGCEAWLTDRVIELAWAVCIARSDQLRS